MILTKQDIQKIDAFLKTDVRNWDIRIEMIDHLASKLEQQENVEITNDFLRNEFGPYWKITETAKLKINAIHFKYRKLFFKNFITSIKSFSGLVLLIFLFLAEFYFATNYNTKQFFKMNMLFNASYSLLFILLQILHYKWKNNSLVLSYINHYIMLPFMFGFSLIYNVLIHFFKSHLEIGIPIIGIITPLTVIWLFSNYKTFEKEHKKYTNYFKSYKQISN